MLNPLLDVATLKFRPHEKGVTPEGRWLAWRLDSDWIDHEMTIIEDGQMLDWIVDDSHGSGHYGFVDAFGEFSGPVI